MDARSENDFVAVLAVLRKLFFENGVDGNLNLHRSGGCNHFRFLEHVVETQCRIREQRGDFRFLRILAGKENIADRFDLFPRRFECLKRFRRACVRVHECERERFLDVRSPVESEPCPRDDSLFAGRHFMPDHAAEALEGVF